MRELIAKGTPGEWGHDLNGFVAPIEDGREWGETIVMVPGIGHSVQDVENCKRLRALKEISKGGDEPCQPSAPCAAKSTFQDAAELEGSEGATLSYPAPAPIASESEAIRLREIIKAIREALEKLVDQADNTDWMGAAGEMDAALDKARSTLTLASKEVAHV